jgi:hypothetical protein
LTSPSSETSAPRPAPADRRNGISRYLALSIGAAEPQEKASVPDDVSQRFMKAWGEWYAEHAEAIVESGAPLGPNRRVTLEGAEAIANQLVAWMVVQHESASDAAAMFARHPHVTLMPGNAVDVMELLPIPTG